MKDLKYRVQDTDLGPIQNQRPEFLISHVVHHLSDTILTTWLDETPDDGLMSCGYHPVSLSGPPRGLPFPGKAHLSLFSREYRLTVS